MLLIAGTAQAQQTKIPKIGYLGIRPDDARTTFELFRSQLQSLGYIEGKNVLYEYRNAENNRDRLPALVNELIRLKVDVFVVAATNEARAVKSATNKTPIVGLNLGDAVQNGLIASLARPGANITGVTPISGELAGKRLELLKNAVPKLIRVAVLWDPNAPSSDQILKDVQAPAKALGLQLHSMEVSRSEKLDNAFKAAVKASSGALTVNLSPMLNGNQRRVHELAARDRLPAIYTRAEFVQSGGLMSYGADRDASFARVAVWSIRSSRAPILRTFRSSAR